MQDVPRFDLYRTLGVPATATRDEIEVAFRAAAKRHHPDTSPDPTGATVRMQQLNVARDWLTDPGRRRHYDQIRGVHRDGVALPKIDPLGDWPENLGASPKPSGASVMPAIALIAMMGMLATVTVGIGSNLITIALFALALLGFVYAGLIVVLRWFR